MRDARSQRVAELAFAAALGAMLVGCAAAGPTAADPTGVPTGTTPGPAPSPAVTGGPAGTEPAVFEERAAELGLDFHHENGMTGQYYFPEVNGAGVAFLDYDGDGDQDLYFVQGGSFEEPTAGVPGRLYRNELLERGAAGFTDVTEAAGFSRVAYGQGVTTGDYDNDGDVDLYLGNFGPDQLFRNNGDGSFTDVAPEAGVSDDRWSASASFVDYDRDGALDLFVGNYVDFALATNKPCYAANGARDACGPSSYRPVPDRLYRNLGDGRFEDVTARAGVSAADGPALGTVAADFNADGWPDIYVANDGAANQLWLNQGGERFTDDALVAGVAYNAMGAAEAGMGVVAEDVENDGDWDIFLSHLTGEHNTLYLNDGQGLFEDSSIASGLAGPSLAHTGFGLGSLDWDADGLVDFAIANGAVKLEAMNVGAGKPDPSDPLALYHQPNLLHRNLGQGRFEDVSARGGPGITVPNYGRGLAVGDLDNDGDPDLVIGVISGPPRLLVNRLGAPGGWLGLRLLTADGRRDALGAEARLTLDDGRVLLRRVHTDGSQVSARDPRILYGLAGAKPLRLDVRWPDGGAEGWDWDAAMVNRYVTVRAGQGPEAP